MACHAYVIESKQVVPNKKAHEKLLTETEQNIKCSLLLAYLRNKVTCTKIKNINITDVKQKQSLKTFICLL